MTPSPWTSQGGSQMRPVKTSTATRDNARDGLPTAEETQAHEAKQRLEAQRRAEAHREKLRGPSLVERILEDEEE